MMQKKTFWAGGRLNKLSQPSIRHLPILPLLMMICIALMSVTAGAADTRLTPKIGVGGGYDDNIFYAPDNEVSSAILTVSPGLALDYQTLLSSFRLSADLDILSYLDESDLNRTNQYYRLSGEHRIKERWSTSGNLNFFRDTTLNTYLQETGRVNERVERDFFDVGGRIRYAVSLLSDISAGYTFQTAAYDGDRFSDFDRHRANLFYSRRMKNEIDTITVGPSYTHRSNDFNDVETVALNVGWARDWSDITSSNAIIGARYATVKSTDGTTDDNWGVQAGFNLSTRGLASTTTFRYFHELRTTAEGNDVNVDNFHLGYRRLLTERFGAEIDGRLVFSYKLFDRQTEVNDSRYFSIEPNIFYRLTQQLNLSLRYRYQYNVELRNEGDITRERNMVWLQLNYAVPLLF